MTLGIELLCVVGLIVAAALHWQPKLTVAFIAYGRTALKPIV
jgi:hypothetical protein